MRLRPLLPPRQAALLGQAPCRGDRRSGLDRLDDRLARCAHQTIDFRNLSLSTRTRFGTHARLVVGTASGIGSCLRLSGRLGRSLGFCLATACIFSLTLLRLLAGRIGYCNLLGCLLLSTTCFVLRSQSLLFGQCLRLALRSLGRCRLGLEPLGFQTFLLFTKLGRLAFKELLLPAIFFLAQAQLLFVD